MTVLLIRGPLRFLRVHIQIGNIVLFRTAPSIRGRVFNFLLRQTP